MIYDYYCTKCDKQWEESHSSDNRDKPCQGVCPCSKALPGVVKRDIAKPSFLLDGIKSVYTRSSPDFKERLKQIKQGAGKFHNIRD